MTNLFPKRISLTDGQKKNLAKAFAGKTALTLRLGNRQLSGNDELMLTKTQVNKLEKAKSQGKGAELKISKTQIRKVMRQGSSIFSAIIPLARTFAPTLAKTLGLSALAGLASEGASQIVKKISGNGVKKGGLVNPIAIMMKMLEKGITIPSNFLGKLAGFASILSPGQRRQMGRGLQSGRGIVLKPTKAQMSGDGLGTILASIGIPMVLDALKSITGKGAPRMGAWEPSSGGLVNLRALQPPPPFFGSWDRPMGAGAPRMGRARSGKGKKKISEGEGLLLGENSPFRNVPILGTLI